MLLYVHDDKFRHLGLNMWDSKNKMKSMIEWTSFVRNKGNNEAFIITCHHSWPLYIYYSEQSIASKDFSWRKRIFRIHQEHQSGGLVYFLRLH